MLGATVRLVLFLSNSHVISIIAILSLGLRLGQPAVLTATDSFSKFTADAV